MPRSRNRRLSWKILLLVVAGLVALSLSIACNGIDTTAPTDESDQPATEADTTDDITDEDVSDEDLPDEGLPEDDTADDLPGDKDFVDNGQPPEDGAILASPAVDMFLKIEGMPGESTEETYEEWIEILSYSWGVSQPSAGSMSSGASRSAERCDFQDFSVVKTLDKTSPKLALYCSKGQYILEIILVICSDDEDKQPYMMYEMTDVIVSSISVSGTDGSEMLPIEEVSFAYGNIKWTYTEVDPVSGLPKGNVEAQWDLETNTGE